MPQDSLTTSSPGQKLESKTLETATPSGISETPMYEFAPGSKIGAEQSFLSSGTLPPPQTTHDPTSAPLGPGPTVPIGASLRPTLRFANIRRTPRLKTRQLWEGTVTEVHDAGFAALLKDKTKVENSDERVIIDFDNTEISPDDLKLIGPGSSFYWVIGSEKTPAGQVRNVSMLQFRRVPAWSEKKLDRIANYVQRVRASLHEDL